MVALIAIGCVFLGALLISLLVVDKSKMVPTSPQASQTIESPTARQSNEISQSTLIQVLNSYTLEAFSAEKYRAVFELKNLEYQRADEGLGLWYGLGCFCIIVSLGAARKYNQLERQNLVNLCLEDLYTKWSATPQVISELKEYVSSKSPSVFDTFQQATNVLKFRRFFQLVASDILGGEISFYPEALTEPLELLRIENPFFDDDHVLAEKLSEIFVRNLSDLNNTVDLVGQSA